MSFEFLLGQSIKFSCLVGIHVCWHRNNAISAVLPCVIMKSAPGFMTVNRLTVNPDLHLGVLAAVASLNWRPIRTLTLNRVSVGSVCVFVCVKVFV